MRAWHRLNAAVRSTQALRALHRCHNGRVCPRSFSQLSSFSTSTVLRDSTYDYEYNPRDIPNPEAKNIAVLGGGITGLVTAHRLAYFLPDAKITLFEASERFGGWVDSEWIDVGNGHVLFEWGPRTLRRTNDTVGASAHTIALLDQLGLHDEVIPISPKSPAAYNRFIYYPDRLVRLPSPRPGWSLWQNYKALADSLQEPLFEDFGQGILNEIGLFKRKIPIQKPVRDESIGDFITRLIGRKPADNIASAIFQGIYAGDIYKLSALTVMPMLKAREGRSMEGSVLGSMARDWWVGEQLHMVQDAATWRQLQSLIPFQPASRQFGLDLKTQASVYSFRKGIGQLTGRLEETLRGVPNIELRRSSAGLAFDSDTKQFQIHDRSRKSDSPGSSPERFDYVVSTIPPKQLSAALAGPTSSQYVQMQSEIKKTAPAVTVMVVNLFFEDPDLVPVEGFGYLIPRSTPREQNPEHALGVIFASQTSHGVFDATNIPGPAQVPRSQDTASGTKLAVMFGGHLWDGWQDSDLPSEEEGIEMACAVLKRHLNITAAPLVAKARLQRDAIPQHTVGYNKRMMDLHAHLRREFGGRLKVAGPAFQGAVGVNDCVRQAARVSFAIREGWDDRTGLEGFKDSLPAMVVSRKGVRDRGRLATM